MTDPNPYAPPLGRPEPSPGPRRRSPIPTVLRAAAVLAGFTLIAGPTRPAPDARRPAGQVAAKGLGVILLIGAFLPIAGRRVRIGPDHPPPEEL